jgi:uncharacterized protein
MCTKVGGSVVLATALFAWGVSLAAVTNATWKRTVLPVFAPAVPAPRRGA